MSQQTLVGLLFLNDPRSTITIFFWEHSVECRGEYIGVAGSNPAPVKTGALNKSRRRCFSIHHFFTFFLENIQHDECRWNYKIINLVVVGSSPTGSNSANIALRPASLPGNTGP